MVTLTIQIGNSDDKLTQERWSQYVREMRDLVKYHAAEIHFSGGSENWARWQNYCWVAVMEEDVVFNLLIDDMSTVRKKYNQNSVAITKGETQFI